MVCHVPARHRKRDHGCHHRSIRRGKRVHPRRFQGFPTRRPEEFLLQTTAAIEHFAGLRESEPYCCISVGMKAVMDWKNQTAWPSFLCGLANRASLDYDQFHQQRYWLGGWFYHNVRGLHFHRAWYMPSYNYRILIHCKKLPLPLPILNPTTTCKKWMSMKNEFQRCSHSSQIMEYDNHFHRPLYCSITEHPVYGFLSIHHYRSSS